MSIRIFGRMPATMAHRSGLLAVGVVAVGAALFLRRRAKPTLSKRSGAKSKPPLSKRRTSSSLHVRDEIGSEGGEAAFISHMKAEAAMEARFLQVELEAFLEARCFLDSDDLRSLDKLVDHVRSCQSLVLVQTASVLTRPYCLLELITAIDANIPIVGVCVGGPTRHS